jgi:hypothetical protein
VESNPINIPVKGLAVVLINIRAKPVPIPLRDELKKSTPKRNKYRKNRAKKILEKTLTIDLRFWYTANI